MIAVINDILMLEHAEAPADDLEQVDMHHVAQEVRSSLQPQAAEKDISVSVVERRLRRWSRTCGS